MKGSRRKRVEITPCAQPNRAPQIITKSNVGTNPQPQVVMIVAVSTLERLSSAPTDRSIPAVMMTNVMPTAMAKKSRRRVGAGCPAIDLSSVAASFIAVVLIGFGYGQDFILRGACGKLGDCTPAPQHDDAIAEADQFRHFTGS